MSKGPGLVERRIADLVRRIDVVPHLGAHQTRRRRGAHGDQALGAGYAIDGREWAAAAMWCRISESQSLTEPDEKCMADTRSFASCREAAHETRSINSLAWMK
jgi:hypothetical protein